MTNLEDIRSLGNIVICDHPLVTHNVTTLRDTLTSAEVFRLATRRVAYILMFEAVKHLPLKTVTVNTPLEITESQIINPEYHIVIAPILRAALLLSYVLEDLLPFATVHHIGLRRDEVTLEPENYYNKLPDHFKDPQKTIVFILDPMFATGGSAVEAVRIFLDSGIPEENIIFVSLISAPEGIINFRNHYKQVKIVTGVVDRQLNEKGYILPGLGDAGDRTFNTLY